MIEEFDYIIIGAGSSGCVIANRLAENNYKVLLLEAGGTDKSIFIDVPIGYYKTIFNPKISWNYWTEEIPTLFNRKMFWPRGKVLGGCSAVNGLIYIRGQRQDFDYWESLGNEGWGWNNVLEYFKKSENQQDFKNSYHGYDGKIAVSKLISSHPLCEPFLDACIAHGIKLNPDFNGLNQEGCGYYQLTMSKGRRWSTAKAYINPLNKNLNFKLSLNSLVSKIIIDKTSMSATGVEYYKENTKFIANARKEIILCAGAINSPKILQLSGIGNAKHLKDLGIEILHHLPAVGENLQDHYQVRIIYITKNGESLNVLSRQLSWKIKSTYDYLVHHKGAFAVGAAQAGAFIKSSPSQLTPDLQLHFIPLSVEVPGKKLHSFSGITISVCQLRPISRGFIRIQSSNPNTPPLIQPNYLFEEEDLITTLKGLDICRKIFKKQPLKEFISSEFEPGETKTDKADLEAFVRNKGTTIFHPVGTCKMGNSNNYVVDSQLKLLGVQGIRIADASIMPTIISGNTNATAIMIGEKASDLILNDREY